MFKIAHITDLHLGRPGEQYLELDLRGRFSKVLEWVVEQDQPDLLVLGGDYSLHAPDIAACKWLRDQLAATKIPYFILSGNHDSSSDLIDVFDHSSLGYGKLYYKYSAGGYDHLVLDSCLGEIDREQLNWLEKSLARAERPLLWMHHPPDLMGAPFMDGRHALKRREPLLQILHAYEQPLDVFCGHYHAAMVCTSKNLTIHAAPPTSFYICPGATVFKQEEYPPGYQLVLLGKERTVVVPRYVG